MGFDYFCPTCDGPAYGENKERECKACENGYPKDYTCHICKCFIHSTTRDGGQRCEAKNCDNMICMDCENRQYCMRCFEHCCTPEQIDAIYCDEIRKLQAQIANLKKKQELLKSGGVEQSECTLQ